MSCPLQKAHPFGGKLKLMIRISERNGSAMAASSAGARERRLRAARRARGGQVLRAVLDVLRAGGTGRRAEARIAAQEVVLPIGERRPAVARGTHLRVGEPQRQPEV